MNMHIKPATPLPWKIDQVEPEYGTESWLLEDSEEEEIAVIHNEDNAAYIVHACNNLPRVLEALSELVAATDRDHEAELGVDTAAALNRASALLKELGHE